MHFLGVPSFLSRAGQRIRDVPHMDNRSANHFNLIAVPVTAAAPSPLFHHVVITWNSTGCPVGSFHPAALAAWKPLYTHHHAFQARRCQDSNYSLDTWSGESWVFRQRWSLAAGLFQLPAWNRAAIHRNVTTVSRRNRAARASWPGSRLSPAPNAPSPQPRRLSS